ncbi:hypothetical protein BDE02_08G094000 [Populus trichocarpa]|nr:hypothetical protein BDE02_08G094000 [Populus trichocarpa]
MISFNDDEDLHFHKAGLLQLACDTNSHPVEELKREGLFQTTLVSKNSKDRKLMSTLPASSHALEGGMAYSGNARKIVGMVLSNHSMVLLVYRIIQGISSCGCGSAILPGSRVKV